ncbi:hypothetical protein ACH5RR_012859 [Cinchona calisaya]|uniref:Uncharacterized protein n=1 Tax=Cinchona calisaya TaxID=153742 RepID=A0ABD3AAK0_9GENT
MGTIKELVGLIFQNLISYLSSNVDISYESGLKIYPNKHITEGAKDDEKSEMSPMRRMRRILQMVESNLRGLT